MRQVCKRGIAAMLAVLMAALLPCFAFAATTMADGNAVDDSYFDDAVFVGDSISLKLKQYVGRQRKRKPGFLGEAQFLTVGGLGSGNVQLPITPDSLHPEYNGEKQYLEDSVAESGARKMYIMFGMNDIVPYGIEGAVENLEALIDKILANSPDLVVAVESVTPILSGKQQRNLNNDNIAAYNEELRSLCERRGFAFLDIASQLADSDGGLVYAYCGDAQGLGMHLSDAGCVPWIEYLRTHPITEIADETESGEDSFPDEDELFDEEAFSDDGDEEEMEREVLLYTDGDGGEETPDDAHDAEDEMQTPEDEMSPQAQPDAEESIVKSADPEEVSRQFALDVTGAPSRQKKPWRPKLKNGILNKE